MAKFLVDKDGSLVPLTNANRPRVADNGTMRSMAMGCPRVRDQAKRLKMLSDRGVQAHYDHAGQLVYEGGYHAQKRAAKMAGLEIG